MDAFKIITSIKYTKSKIDAVNHMTYFVDYNWNENSNTLPAVFFYLMSFNSTKRNEINTNTLIVYDDSDISNANNVKQANTQVVADNCVSYPEEYKMDILIPYRMTQMNYLNPTSDLGAGNFGFTLAKTMINVLGSVLRNSSSASQAAIGTMMNENLEQPDSLKEMANRRLPIQMKLPYGWKFVNGIITSLDMRKEPDEENMMNASITMMVNPPIMQYKRSGTAKPAYVDPSYKRAGMDLQNLLRKISGES